MNDVQNRIDRASKAFAAYTDEGGFTGDSVEDNIVDLVSDLRHLAALYGVDFDYVIRVSGNHYQAEIN